MSGDRIYKRNDSLCKQIEYLHAKCESAIHESWWIDGERWFLKKVDGLFVQFSNTYLRRTMEFVR